MVFEKIKTNPKNPRQIKNNEFKRLKESIKRFPEMLEKRPIVKTGSEDGWQEATNALA